MIVAITGASGSIYGIRLIQELLKRGDVNPVRNPPNDNEVGKGHKISNRVNLIISPSGFLVIEQELGLRLGRDKKRIETALKRYFKILATNLKYHHYDDLLSPLSSGSSSKPVPRIKCEAGSEGFYQGKEMIICPCSMGTMARIACGISGNLIERTADVVLKEKGRLILVPRETPLNEIHIENMLKLCKMGVHIVPAMPGFYHKPKKIEDIVDFVVGKILDALGIENRLYKRWG